MILGHRVTYNGVVASFAKVNKRMKYAQISPPASQPSVLIPIAVKSMAAIGLFVCCLSAHQHRKAISAKKRC